MILLTSTSDKLQLITTATANTDVHASWVDNASGTITPGRTDSNNIVTATTTDIVGSPGASTQRAVKTFTIRNKHASTSQTITVVHTDGAVTMELIKCTLLAGEELHYQTGQGFLGYDTSGGIKQAGRSGRYLRTTLLSSGTQFTTGPDTNSIFVRMVGGGAQGGGCTVGSASISGGAGGGSAGGYAEKTFSVSPNTQYTYAIGSGGSTSGTGATTGQVGGDTTFTVGATTVTAKGGNGGLGCTSAATVVTLGGGPPAVSTNGDLNASGAPGGHGFVSAVGVAVSGHGGSSQLGAGANGLKTQGTGASAASLGFGGGGGGGCTISTTGAVAGGAGAGGCILVDEFA
jgi:hypothetical protein